MGREGSKNSKYTFGKLFQIMGFVFVAWLVSGAAIYFSIDSWSERGAFGDMFGTINAIFSGLAFAGIIFTILLQREELKFQREELELTRVELKRTASAQEASEKALSEQAETLNKTAQINAINTLMSICQAQVSLERQGRSRSSIITPLNEKIIECQISLESLLKSLEKK